MTHIQPHSIHRSSRYIAEENELSTLKLLHVYGHARRAEIARAIWPTSSPRMSERMAQRTVGRLTARRQVVGTLNTLGGDSLLLAKAGAARLRDWGIDARQGGDMSSITGAQFCHRTLGTQYLIERQVQGHISYGEHAIASGLAPVSRPELEHRFLKVPDGLVLLPADERGYAHGGLICDWIEVEWSRKPYQELKRILDVVWESGAWLDDSHTVMLDRVVFVYDHRRGHEKAIANALQRYVLTRPSDNWNALLAAQHRARTL